MQKAFPMILDHVDSFGKFLKFFVQKHLLPKLLKTGAAFSKIQFVMNFSS